MRHAIVLWHCPGEKCGPSEAGKRVLRVSVATLVSVNVVCMANQFVYTSRPIILVKNNEF